MNDPTAADVVAAARMAVYMRHPYLSSALFALRPHPAPGLGTMAVDEGWRLYYDPETVLRWHEEETRGKLNKISGVGAEKIHHGVAAAIFHELGHVLRQHHKRRGNRHPDLWNRAADREINDDLIEAKWILPVEPLLPKDIGKPPGLLAEEYFFETHLNPKGRDCEPIQMPQNAMDSATWRQCPGCGAACGGAAGNPTEWEKDNAAGSDAAPAPAAAGELEQEITLRKCAIDTINHMKAKGRGTVPSGLQAWAAAMLEPAKVDWRKKLAHLVRQALMSVAGASDFTWRRSGRRALHSAGRAGYPMTPAYHQPVPKVAVVLDTSGSMQTDGKDRRTLLQEALSEVYGIVKAAGGDCMAVACDADVHAVARIRGAADLEKLNKGGGGTIMAPGFLAARKSKPDIVVIVTDSIVGDGWPTAEQCQGVRVLAAVVGNSVTVPEYIACVEVDK